MNHSTHNVVFLDRGSVSADKLSFEKLYKNFPNCEVYEHSTPEEVIKRVRNADIAITNKAVLSSQAIANATRLKMISVMATGYNNVGIKAASNKDITVSNVRSYGTPSVAQHTFMLILSLATRFTEYSNAVRQGAWNKSPQFCLLDYNITELSGKTLGIIGHGELGRAVGEIAKAFGMQVLIAARKGSSPSEGRTDFQTIITGSDVITLHCPLNEETRNLIDAPELEQMKSSAFLINTARGGIVNEQALKNALIKGHIAGAAFDVLSEEPPANGNLLLDNNIPNLIITPHTAWASLEAQQRLFDMTVQNVISFLEGRPENVVV
ncbi:MAG: 2-hydroxyacid dehydrogenase [Methyloligellaceae bacterium]